MFRFSFQNNIKIICAIILAYMMEIFWQGEIGF